MIQHLYTSNIIYSKYYSLYSFFPLLQSSIQMLYSLFRTINGIISINHQDSVTQLRSVSGDQLATLPSHDWCWCSNNMMNEKGTKSDEPWHTRLKKAASSTNPKVHHSKGYPTKLHQCKHVGYVNCHIIHNPNLQYVKSPGLGADVVLSPV